MAKLNKHTLEAYDMVLDTLDKIEENPANCVTLTDVLPDKVSAVVCELLAEKIHMNARIESYTLDVANDFEQNESAKILTAVEKLHNQPTEECMTYLKDFRFETGIAVLDVLGYEQVQNCSFEEYVHIYTKNALTGSKKFADKEQIKACSQDLQHILVNYQNKNISATEAEGLLETRDFFTRKALRDEAFADLQALNVKATNQTLETLERKRNGLNPYYANDTEAKKVQKEEIRQRREIRKRLKENRLRHQNKKRSAFSKLFRSAKKGIGE